MQATREARNPNLLATITHAWHAEWMEWMECLEHDLSTRVEPRGKFTLTNEEHYTDLWVVTRHQCRLSAVVPQTSFPEKTIGGVVKWRLFSQTKSDQKTALEQERFDV